MKKEFLNNTKYADKLVIQMEKDLVNQYRATNKSFKLMFADLYSKYDKQGVLTYQEMNKYNRLKDTQKMISKEVNSLYAREKFIMNNKLTSIYKNGYYRTAFTLENELKMKLSYSLIKPEKIKLAIQNPISGLTLSETLAKNKAFIKIKINQEMTQGLIRGEPYSKMAKRMTEALGGDAKKATRIARTEGHRIHEESSFESVRHAENIGVKMIKVWSSTLDGATRDAHGELDNVKKKVEENFRSSAGGVGLTPGTLGNASDDINCRCSLVYEVEGVKQEFRRIRGEGVVPYKTYSQWAKDKGVK